MPSCKLMIISIIDLHPPTQPRQWGGHSASGWAIRVLQFLPLTPKLPSLFVADLGFQANKTVPCLPWVSYGEFWHLESIVPKWHQYPVHMRCQPRILQHRKKVQKGGIKLYKEVSLTHIQWCTWPPTVTWTSNFNKTDVQQSTSWAFALVWMWDGSWAYAIPSGRLSSSPRCSSPLWVAF